MSYYPRARRDDVIIIITASSLLCLLLLVLLLLLLTIAYQHPDHLGGGVVVTAVAVGSSSSTSSSSTSIDESTTITTISTTIIKNNQSIIVYHHGNEILTIDTTTASIKEKEEEDEEDNECCHPNTLISVKPIDNNNNNNGNNIIDNNNGNNIIHIRTSSSSSNSNNNIVTNKQEELKQIQRKQQRNLQRTNSIDPNCDITTYDYSTITSCIPFNDFTGGTTVFTSRLVIPCGQCVSIPTSVSTNYTFYDGIDIQGKLTIDCTDPTNALTTTIVIQTASIIVQGQFIIDTRCKPIINGIPLVQIIMISKSDFSSTTFQPINPIVQGHCNTTITGCNIGEKSITVAGGTINLYGLPGYNPDIVPTWVNLYDVTYQNNNVSLPVTAIILNDMNIATTWSVGATIIITTFTSTWNQFQQVRTITQIISNSPNSGLVTLVLNSTIIRPTTILDDPNYAVEVALLSRNIQFTSIPNGRNNTVGGHFWIFFTPDKYQIIQGIDLHQFGQQGLLGRYPIHFHHCSNVTTGTIISKNTIRQSFQRCIVIHGTNNVIISNNVAYDTAGHCYMLEDGIEINNVFERNIGIMTKNPLYIIPNIIDANNGDESDGSCSTFWITNTYNSFSNNVVAGSQDSGYWFQLLKRGVFVNNYPNLNPKGNTLLYFQNNVAHSTVSRGLRTYSSGYNPSQTARMVGLRIYRNYRTGIFFRRSSNIEVVDSILADNGLAISIQRTSATIRLSNVSIIGETNNYRTNVRLKRYGTVCFNRNGYNLGIEPRTYTNAIGNTAYRFDNVRFSGFNHGNCSYVFPISFDFNPTDGEYIFVGYSTMNNLNFADNNPISIDYCRATNNNITNVYVTDIDGSLKPTSITGAITAPATIVSLQPIMLQFVDPSKCTNVPSQCLSYCQDTCFRAILLEVERSGTDGYQVKICQKANPTNCIVITGVWSPKRWFPAYLPIGDYTALFIDGQGQPVFPTYVRQITTDTACPKPGNVTITIIEPPVSIASCVQLLRNGNLDASSVSPLYWYSQGRVDLQLLLGAGMYGSNALGSYPNDTQPTFVQYFDTRCWKFMVGSIYQLSAQLKLLTADGQVRLCNKTAERCPRIGITMDALPNVTSTFKVAEGATTDPTSDFQTITGTFRITPDLLNRTGIRFFIQAYNYQLRADNLSMRIANYTSPTLSPSNAPIPQCSNMVANSDMELGYKGYWNPEMFGTINQVRPGYNSNTALKYTKMFFRQTGPKIVASAINFSCLTATTTKWIVTVRVKIIERGSRNTGASCDVTTSCPAVVVRIRDTNGDLIVSHTTRSYVSEIWDPDGFNRYSDTIDLPTDPTWVDRIQKINIGFGHFPPQWELVWDDFEIQPL